MAEKMITMPAGKIPRIARASSMAFMTGTITLATKESGPKMLALLRTVVPS